jgi:hypothetical protein
MMQDEDLYTTRPMYRYAHLGARVGDSDVEPDNSGGVRDSDSWVAVIFFFRQVLQHGATTSYVSSANGLNEGHPAAKPGWRLKRRT